MSNIKDDVKTGKITLNLPLDLKARVRDIAAERRSTQRDACITLIEEAVVARDEDQEWLDFFEGEPLSDECDWDAKSDILTPNNPILALLPNPFWSCVIATLCLMVVFF